MASGQQLLFAPEKPLVKRFGKKFFQRIPQRPGVYQMHDARGKVVYVGKAKNLRQRLADYRIAHPEQSPRRRLRLLREVARIEFQLCPSETAALKQEAKLIRELKPKFNRAGVWQPAPRFIAWRYAPPVIVFAVQETPQPGWNRLGPLGSRAPRLRDAVVRLLWLVLHGRLGYAALPRGWANGAVPALIQLDCADRFESIREALETDFCLRPEQFALRIQTMLPEPVSNFNRLALVSDLETLQDFAARQGFRRQYPAQMALL
jgi:predicted GIY-YIG superfamily endonuclease